MEWVIGNAKGWKRERGGGELGRILVATQQNMSNCLSTAGGQNTFIDQCVSSWSLKLCKTHAFIQTICGHVGKWLRWCDISRLGRGQGGVKMWILWWTWEMWVSWRVLLASLSRWDPLKAPLSCRSTFYNQIPCSHNKQKLIFPSWRLHLKESWHNTLIYLRDPLRYAFSRLLSSWNITQCHFLKLDLGILN